VSLFRHSAPVIQKRMTDLLILVTVVPPLLV